MHGRQFSVEAAKIGETAPPFHPHCRCRIMPALGQNANGEGNVKIGSLDDLPSNAKTAYNHYENNSWRGNYHGQTPGTNAGRAWGNEFGELQTNTPHGAPITYREFDVNNKIPGISRDGERFLHGSDGSVYYTSDHYATFIKIR